MALVPRVEGPSVGNQVVQTAKRQPLPGEVFQNQGLKGALSGLDVFDKARAAVDKQRSEADAENAVLSYEKQKRNLFYNQDGGYFNTMGKTAYDQAPTIETSLSDIQRLTGEKLTPEAAAIYNRITQSDLVRAGQSISQHAAKGNHQYTIATKDAVIEDSLEKANLYWGDDFDKVNKDGKKVSSDFTIALVQGEEALIERLMLQGITDGKLYQESLDDYYSGMYASKISGALNDGSPDALATAEADMISFGDDITPDTRVKLVQELDRQKDILYIDQSVTAIRDNNPEYKDQITAAKAETDPERKAEIIRQLDNYRAIDDRIKTAEQTDLFNDWSVKIGEQGVPFSKIPMAQLEGLTHGQRASLKSLEDDKARDKVYTQDWQVWTELEGMTDEDIAAIENPMEYRNKLDNNHYDRLLNQWSALRTNRDKPAAADLWTDTRTKANAMKGTLTQIIGEVPGAGTGVNKLKWANDFERMFQHEVTRMESEKKGKLTPTEYEEALNNFTGKTNMPDAGWLWFDKDVSMKEIPGEQLMGIRQMVIEARGEVNAQTMLGTYNAINRLNDDKDIRKQVTALMTTYAIPISDANMAATYIHMLEKGLIDD